MHNLLTEPLIRFRADGGKVETQSLPEVMDAMMEDRVESFTALRPHQRHAWHAFLVQLSAIAMHRAGRDDLPSNAAEWRGLIRSLTSNVWPDDEPWRLVVEDITKPAFMQPPATSPEGKQDYKSNVMTPDELDLLVTSKNHDLKSAVAREASLDDWLFALVTLQTMEGFGGAGNYGISRMNGGLGNRSSFSLAPLGNSPGPHMRRDILALVESMSELLSEAEDAGLGTRDGQALLWTLAWDGQAPDLSMGDLHPLYIEVCRRIRIQSVGSIVSAIRTTTKAARIDAKALNGRTGDPWALVDRKGGKLVTMAANPFTYKRVADYLTSPDFEPPRLFREMRVEQDSGDRIQLMARTMVRGQGKTEGYYERVISVRQRLRAAIQRRSGDEVTDIGRISHGRIQDVGKVESILSHAIAVFAARGDRNNVKDEHRQTARPWRARLNGIVDTTFFDDLQDELEENNPTRQQEIRSRWLMDPDNRTGIIFRAQMLLEDAVDSLPCPAVHRYRAREAASGVFWGRLRGNNGFPDIFDRDEEITHEAAIGDSGDEEDGE